VLQARHVDATDEQVGHFVTIIGWAELLIDHHRYNTVDPARDDDSFLIRLTPQHLEAFATEMAKECRVDDGCNPRNGWHTPAAAGSSRFANAAREQNDRRLPGRNIDEIVGGTALVQSPDRRFASLRERDFQDHRQRSRDHPRRSFWGHLR